MGCLRKDSYTKEAWVRVVGLPLHLWSREVFKKIGDGCAGFITVDEDIVFFTELQWAKILVKLVGRIYLALLKFCWGRGVIPFKYGGKPHLGLRRWCRWDENTG